MLRISYIKTKHEENYSSYGVVFNNIFTQPRFGVDRQRTGQDVRTVSTDVPQRNKKTAVGNGVPLMQAREEAHARASHEPDIVRLRADASVIVNRRECNAQHAELCHDENKELKYDEIPSYFSVLFLAWFPRKALNHNSKMPNEGEDLILQGEVTVMVMSVSPF